MKYLETLDGMPKRDVKTNSSYVYKKHTVRKAHAGKQNVGTREKRALWRPCQPAKAQAGGAAGRRKRRTKEHISHREKTKLKDVRHRKAPPSRMEGSIKGETRYSPYSNKGKEKEIIDS